VKKALLALVAVIIVGCATPESQLVGKWEGDVEVSAEGQQVPFHEVASSLGKSFTMEIKEDGTFRMVAFIVPMEGTWQANGREVTFTPNEVLGFKGGQSGPFTLQLSSDGKALELGETTQPQSRFRFKKQVQNLAG
jgi:hypothetical protein